MLKLDRVLNQERLLRAMTGLNRQAFNELLSQFADTYERTVFNSLANRKRAPGGGRKPTLRSIEEKLFYILLYCKFYPTYRNRVTDFDDQLMLVSAGLWNFYLDAA